MTSCRIDTASEISGACVIGVRGLGVLGSAVPATGTDGPGFLYNGLLGSELSKEVRGYITRWPSVGTLTPLEDTSFTYLRGSVGGDSFDYTKYVDGASVDTGTVYLYEGPAANLTAANCTQANTSPGGAITIGGGVTLTAAASTQANLSSTGAVVTQANLTAAACTQANLSSNGSIATQIYLTGATSVQANLSSAGAISASGGSAINLTAAACTQVNLGSVGGISEGVVELAPSRLRLGRTQARNPNRRLGDIKP